MPDYTENLVSILTVTLDHYELACACLGRSLECAGHPYEFLCVDNGSSDRRVVSYVDTLKSVYHRLNATNEGFAPMVNQMILRAQGEFICVLDPDMDMPQNWLAILVDHNRAIPETGVSTFHCVLQLPPERMLYGRRVHPAQDVFGAKFFHRRILEKLGSYCEEYSPYGLEDNDFNYRLHLTGGFVNYYIGGGKFAVHRGEDSQDKGAYRQMKWECLRRNGAHKEANFRKYEATGNYYIPLPPMR